MRVTWSPVLGAWVPMLVLILVLGIFPACSSG